MSLFPVDLKEKKEKSCMVTERVAIWDFINVKDCDFCLKLCRILNKLKKITHFLEEIYKTKKFYTFT